jgi:BASS family bile acid:Na+ symporter
MATLLDVVVPLLVIVVMTVLGMDLRVADFRRVREYPILVPAVVLGQWALVTLGAGAIVKLLPLAPTVAGGALLVAAAPVAALSCLYTQLAGGHLALAVTIAAVSNAVAGVVTPLAAALAFRWFADMGPDFALPAGRLAQQMLLGLVLPLAAGMLVRHLAPVAVARARGLLQVLSTAAIVAVLTFVVVDQFTSIRAQITELLTVSALFTLVMLAVGAIASRLVAQRSEDRRAVLWGFPARNVGIATLIATAVVGQVAMASFVAVLFATQVAVLVPLAFWLRRRAGGRADAGTATESTSP